MSKYIPAYMIFLFWIILPLPFMLMGYNSYMKLDFLTVATTFSNGDAYFESGGFNILLGIGNFIWGFLQLFFVYIKTFVMTIPNAPVWLNLGLIFPLKAISLLVAMFLLKE